jgi:hypothetical protein
MTEGSAAAARMSRNKAPARVPAAMTASEFSLTWCSAALLSQFSCAMILPTRSSASDIKMVAEAASSTAASRTSLAASRYCPNSSLISWMAGSSAPAPRASSSMREAARSLSAVLASICATMRRQSLSLAATDKVRSSWAWDVVRAPLAFARRRKRSKATPHKCSMRALPSASMTNATTATVMSAPSTKAGASSDRARAGRSVNGLARAGFRRVISRPWVCRRPHRR